MRRCHSGNGLLETSHYGSGLSESSFLAQAASSSPKGPVMTGATSRQSALKITLDASTATSLDGVTIILAD